MDKKMKNISIYLLIEINIQYLIKLNQLYYTKINHIKIYINFNSFLNWLIFTFSFFNNWFILHLLPHF